MNENGLLTEHGWFTSPLLNRAKGVRHCFTTRRGGVSTGSLSSLNIGISRGDLQENVEENYRRLARAVGFDEENIAITKQVHGDTVRTVQKGGSVFDPVPFPCDALVTNVSEIALVVFTADCVPILLYDKASHCIGAVHAGWRGTANGILQRTIERMCDEFGANPASITAAIGPSIGPCCFEVDASVYDLLKTSYPEIDSYCERKQNKYYPDLKALNKLMLERCGLKSDSISISDSCTKCAKELFWSHRRDGSDRGLQGAVIVLKD